MRTRRGRSGWVRRWRWISAALLLLGIVFSISGLRKPWPDASPITPEQVEEGVPEQYRPLVGSVRAWRAASAEEQEAFLRWLAEVGIEVQRQRATQAVQAQHVARIARVSRITSELFHVLALLSLLLLVRPLFVSHERAPRRLALWIHSALATGVLLVSLFLLQGCLELMMGVTQEINALADPEQALIDTGFARVRDDVRAELERIDDGEAVDPAGTTPYGALIGAASGDRVGGYVTNILRNLEYVDPEAFKPVLAWSRRAWSVIGYAPLGIPFIVVLVVLLTMRATLAEIVSMPIDAARGEKGSARRAVGKASLFVAKEFLSILALIAALFPAGMAASLGVRRLCHDALDILLAQSRSTLVYLGEMSEPPDSATFTFGLLTVPALLAITTLLGTVAVTLFGIRARKLLHNKVHRGWPLRRKDRIWRRSFMAMLRLQWIPVLLVWVLTPTLMGMHAGMPESASEAFSRLSSTGLLLSIALPVAFLLFGGIGAVQCLWPLQRLAPADPGAYTLRDSTPEDAAFLRKAHHKGLKASVVATWGAWDVALQDGFVDAWLAKAQPQVIVAEGRPAGYLEVEDRPTQVHVANIVLLPKLQGQGLGTRILQDVIADATARHLPVHLQVMKGNPARELYERLGFKRIGETEHHIQMLRPIPPVR